MARIDDLFNYLQTPGLTDQQIAAEIGRLGVTTQEVSQLTGVPVEDVQSRLTAVAPVAAPVAAPVVAPVQELFNYLQAPNLTDQQIASEIGRLGVTAEQVSELTGVPVADVQSRLTTAAPVVTAPPVVTPPPVVTQPPVVRPPVVTAPVVTPPGLLTPPVVTPPPVVRPPVATPPVNTNLPTFTNFLQTPGLTDRQIAAEMNRLGITTGQVANLTGVSQNDVQTRFNATAPFSNATQGFNQNFANYQSIPIGGQYNPAVTAGGASPYSQIMSQMGPLGNPYAGVVGNLSMGGYNPALYEQIAAGNVAKTAADTAAAATQTGMEQSSTGGMAKGGMVHGGLMFGMNPPGPDDGAVNLDMGEYVIKKSSVNKYGRGLLDMINEGKVPAKKMKSLLG
jgi:bacterioferritin-associated ferredoxin